MFVTKRRAVQGKIRHLLERDGRYFARLVVPKALRPFAGKCERRKPLGAEEPFQAGVLVLETLQPLRLADIHAAKDGVFTWLTDNIWPHPKTQASLYVRLCHYQPTAPARKRAEVAVQ